MWTFCGSQSYVSALESKNDGNCPFVSTMLLRCRALSRQWEVPRHLYSHLQGTFLDDLQGTSHDEVLGWVDAFTKDIALEQQPELGWIAAYRSPRCALSTRQPPPLLGA